MRSRWYRSILFLVIGSCAAALGPSAAALAVCPLRPPPPCGPVGFTGRPDAPLARCGHEPRRVCGNERGPKGPRGEPGKTGPRGQTGQTGSRGVQGSAGPRGIEGSTGSPGAAGATGPAGLQGVQGETGPQGLQGVQGEVGAAGPEGPPGTDGAAGAAGVNGEPGEQGLQGEQGAAGVDGAPGAEGPEGPAGEAGPPGPQGPEGTNGLAEYGYVYNTVLETVALGGAVSFGSNGILSPGIEHVAGTTDIFVTTPGIYAIDFSTSTVAPSQLTLFVDGVPISGSTYGSGAGTQQNGGQVIASLPAGAVLTLRNYLSSAAVELQPSAGGTQASTNASILITLIDGTP